MEPKFVTQTDFTLEEYRQYVKTMMGSRKKERIIGVVLGIWILAAAVMYITKGRYVLAAFMIIVVVGSPIVVEAARRKQLENTFDAILKTRGNIFTVSFFEDHLESDSLSGHGTYDYSKLYGVIETETNFYIMDLPNQGIIVQKKNCSGELIDFIRQELKK